MNCQLFSKKVFSVVNQDEEDEDYDNSDEVMGYDDDDENSGGQTEQELEFIHPEADYSMLFNRYLFVLLLLRIVIIFVVMCLCYVTQEAANRREKTRTIL